MIEDIFYTSGCDMGPATCEVAHKDYEKIVTMKICEIIIDSIGIGWQNRHVFLNLLYSNIKDRVVSRGKEGLLEQYLHSQLDPIADRIKNEFDLNEDIKIDYGHANHAKFNSIIQAIKNKYMKGE